MANPFVDIDRLVARFQADKDRVWKAVREARATSFKVLPNNIWKCHFRPYGAERPEVLRGGSADELLKQLAELVTKSAADKEAAKKAREEQRKAHRADVERTRAEVKKLGARRFRVRRLNGGGHRWLCHIRDLLTKTVREFDEASAEKLLAALRDHVRVLGGRADA